MAPSNGTLMESGISLDRLRARDATPLAAVVRDVLRTEASVYLRVVQHSVSSGTDGVFAPPRRALTVGILLAVAVFAVEGMGVVPALPSAVAALGGMALFGWSFSAFMLAWIIGTVASGEVADQRGPFRPAALGLLGFAAGLALAASAHGMGRFILGRALQGAGGGSMVASAYVAIARGYPDALRPRMMALTASVWVLPSVVGPALSGAVVQRWGWRVVFAAVIPVVGLVSALVLRPLRPFDLDLHPLDRPSRIPVAVRLALGCALVLAAPSWSDHGLAVSLAVAGVGAVLLFPALHTLLPMGTLRGRRGLPMGIALRGLLALAFFGAEAFVPLSAISLRAATPTAAGLALTAASLGWISMSWLQERVESQGGPSGRVMRVRVGFALVSVGIVMVLVTLVTQFPLGLVAVGWGIGGAGIGLAYNAGGLICLALAPTGAEGEVSGQLQMSEALGTSMGAGVGGALLAYLRGQHQPLAVAHATVFVGCIVVAMVGAGLAGRATD